MLHGSNSQGLIKYEDTISVTKIMWKLFKIEILILLSLFLLLTLFIIFNLPHVEPYEFAFGYNLGGSNYIIRQYRGVFANTTLLLVLMNLIGIYFTNKIYKIYDPYRNYYIILLSFFVVTAFLNYIGVNYVLLYFIVNIIQVFLVFKLRTIGNCILFILMHILATVLAIILFFIIAIILWIVPIIQYTLTVIFTILFIQVFFMPLFCYGLIFLVCIMVFLFSFLTPYFIINSYVMKYAIKKSPHLEKNITKKIKP